MDAAGDVASRDDGTARLTTLRDSLREKMSRQEHMLGGLRRMEQAAGVQSAATAARGRVLRREIEARVRFLEHEVATVEGMLGDGSKGTFDSKMEVCSPLVHMVAARDAKLTRAGVLFRLQHIQERLRAEEALRSALRLMVDGSDASSSDALNSDATGKSRKRAAVPSTPPDGARWVATESAWQLYLCEAKIALLGEALRAYESFLPIAEYTAVFGSGAETPTRPVSGTLRLRIGDVVLPDETPSGLDAEGDAHGGATRESVIVQVWTDGTASEPVKVKRRRGRAPVEMDVALTHTHIVEVVVFDKRGRPTSVVALRPAWLADVDHGGAVSAAFLGGALEADVALLPEGRVFLYARVVEDATAATHGAGLGHIDAAQETRIQRQRAVRRRAMRTLGHELGAMSGGYALLRCGHCRDLVYAGALRCRRCKYTVHRGCAPVLHVRCVADAAGFAEWEGLTARLAAASQPHVFAAAPSRSVPTFCCHCGQIIVLGPFSGGRNDVLKCGGCGLHAHADCETFVPPLCGLSRKDAASITRQFQTDALLDVDGLGGAADTGGAKADGQRAASLGVGAELPTLREEDFAIEAVIGRGNFGKVVLARHRRSGTHVALKAIKKAAIADAGEREGLANERAVFAAVASEPSPFLVRSYGVFQSASRVFFAMEYVPGGDLMFHIQRVRRFAPDAARFYAAETLLALEWLHDRNIAYRDLKLDNILLTAEGHAKLADYGLCKPGMARATTTTTFCGTTEFLAPEVLLEQPYTRATDWWAYGVLVYELLWARAPFAGRSDRDVYAAILNAPLSLPSDPPGCSPKDALVYARGRDLVSQLLQRDPTLRLSHPPAIRSHSFFSGVDWSALSRLAVKPPPLVPALSGPADVSCFEAEFTSEPAQLTPQPSAKGVGEDPFFDNMVGSFANLLVERT